MPDDKDKPPKNMNLRFEVLSTGLASGLFFTACFFLTKWAIELRATTGDTDTAVQALKLIGLGVCAVLAVFSFIGMFVVWFEEASRVGKARAYHEKMARAKLGPWTDGRKH